MGNVVGSLRTMKHWFSMWWVRWQAPVHYVVGEVASTGTLRPHRQALIAVHPL